MSFMDLTRIIELQRALTDPEGIWQDAKACQTLETLLRTDRLYEVGPTGPNAEMTVSSASISDSLAEGIKGTFSGFDADGFSTFVDPYASFLHRVLRQAGAGAFHDGPLFCPEQREATEVHARALGPNQIDRQMAASTPLEKGEAMLIAGYKNSEVPDQDGSAFKWLQMLEPAFTAGRRLRSEIERYEAEWSLSIDALPAALLVYDSSGRLLHRNARFDALAATSPWVETCQPAATSLAKRLLMPTRRARYMSNAPLDVTATHATPAGQVQLSASRAPWPYGDPICLVTVSLAGRAGSVDLTPRETEVSALISQGLPDKEIARQLDISLHTARRHVERVLSKTGCKNRTEVAIKLANIS